MFFGGAADKTLGSVALTGASGAITAGGAATLIGGAIAIGAAISVLNDIAENATTEAKLERANELSIIS